MEKFLTTTEVGEYLRITDLTVRRYIKAGLLTSKKIGRNHRIPESSLMEFINSHDNDKLRAKGE